MSDRHERPVGARNRIGLLTLGMALVGPFAGLPRSRRLPGIVFLAASEEKRMFQGQIGWTTTVTAMLASRWFAQVRWIRMAVLIATYWIAQNVMDSSRVMGDRLQMEPNAVFRIVCQQRAPRDTVSPVALLKL